MKPTKVLLYYLILWVLLGVSACSKRFAHSVQQVPSHKNSPTTSPDYSDSTITVAAGEHYNRGWLHTLLYGSHYRTVWATPVEAPVLDIGTAHGGLTPTELGGSRQTINLRLVDSTGTEYVLRSLDKEPASALPEKWQQSYLAHIVRDATSATHPYAALVLPPMLKSLGVYHVEPELVYVPHDPRLGEFMDDVGGMLALLERRPNNEQLDYAPMGNAPKVKSTRSALEERLKDNDTYFDARAYLRARLFDMIIGDWSRHEDNWRWAEMEHDDKAYTYKAIPRDRDNVFYKLHDGPVPWLLQRLGIKPHFQTYRANISPSQLEKLNRSARNLDELILSGLEWQAWQEIADSVQQALTDEVIVSSFNSMPDTIAALSAKPLIRKLKARRDDLPQMARSYYKTLAEKVQVVGTDKHERFEVEVLGNGDVLVQVYKTERDGELQQKYYQRLFQPSETKRLQLYGLNGDDQFVFSGRRNSKIRVEVWGGAGEDKYKIEGSKPGKHLYLYDTLYRNTLEVNKQTHVELDNDQKAKNFDAEGWLLRYYLD